MADKNMERKFEEWAGNKPVEFPDMDKDPVSFWCWKAWQKATEIEREECAKACDDEANFASMQAREGGRAMDDGRAIGAESCAKAIRARKVGSGDTAKGEQ